MPSQRVREAWAEAATEDAAGETAAPEAGANEKDEWFEQVSALKQKQVYIERHLRLGMDSVRNKFSDKNHEVQQLATASVDERSKLRGDLEGGLARVRSSVAYLQKLLATPATNEMYVSSLATQMDACETEIESLKIQQNQDYERLGRVEVLLSREIEAFQRRIKGQAWEPSASASSETKARGSGPESSGATRRKSAPSSHLRSSRGDLLPEVIELEEFVKTHGLFGGWSEDEHKDFLRLFQRCGQSYTKVLSVCMTQMPYFSREEIVAHCKWDAEHKNLLRRRRQAIQAWRERKDAQKEEEKKRGGTTWQTWRSSSPTKR